MAREFELVLHSLTQLVTQLVSQCSLFTVHYSLFTVHRSPFTHSLTVTHFVDSFLHFFISSQHRHCHFIFHSSFIFLYTRGHTHSFLRWFMVTICTIVDSTHTEKSQTRNKTKNKFSILLDSASLISCTKFQFHKKFFRRQL